MALQSTHLSSNRLSCAGSADTWHCPQCWGTPCNNTLSNSTALCNNPTKCSKFSLCYVITPAFCNSLNLSLYFCNKLHIVVVITKFRSVLLKDENVTVQYVINNKNGRLHWHFVESIHYAVLLHHAFLHTHDGKAVQCRAHVRTVGKPCMCRFGICGFNQPSVKNIFSINK